MIINLLNTSDRTKAEKIQKALEGKTFMKFRVTLCPYQGEIVVNAETDYTEDKEEATGMLLMIMADMISK